MTYECSLCERSLISSFYMCSNCHITCFRCYSRTPHNRCKLCGQGQVYCCEFSKYRLDEMNHLLFKRATGPIVVLPTSKVCQAIDTCSENYCDSDDLNSFLPSYNGLMKCLDCQKCVFQSRVLEHYISEHKEKLICPVPPGSMIICQLNSKDIEIGQMKTLQLLQLMDIVEENSNSSVDDEATVSEGNEKLLFLMAEKVTLHVTEDRSVNIVKLWLFSTFRASTSNYSIEVTGTRNNSVSIIFTGVPINASSVDIPLRGNFSSVLASDFSHGQMLSVRESLLHHFEDEGICTVNIYIHNNYLND